MHDEGEHKEQLMWMVKGRAKNQKMLTGKMQALQKDGWQDREEKLCQEKFCKELGLEPMTKFGVSNAANEDNNSNSDTKFGGEHAFEDF